MGKLGRFLAFGTVISLFMLTAVAASGSGTRQGATSAIPAFTPSQSAAPSGANWISENGNVMSWRYSTLTQINASNGTSLKLAWSQTLPAAPSSDLASTGNAGPVVYNGTVYMQDKWGRIFAGGEAFVKADGDEQAADERGEAPADEGEDEDG